MALELTDADSPIQIAGTVYSEMQGAFTITQAAESNNLASSFYGGACSYISGGTLAEIPTLTVDDLTTFHDTYYQPSNSLIILYGNLNIERYLEAIDTGYLSQYDATEVTIETGLVEPYTETRYNTYDYPVEQGAQTDNASFIYYTFVGHDSTLEDSVRMDLLCNVLSQESSPVMVSLREAFPQAGISVAVDNDSSSPMLYFMASGVNEADRDTFVSIIDESLAKLVSEGFAQDDLDAVLASKKRALLLTGEDTNLAVNASMSIALRWAYFDRTDYYVAYENTLNAADADMMMDTLKKWITGNSYRSVSVTRPAAGLAEQNAAALEARLAELKAGMTDEEIAAMVQSSTEFTEWSSAAVDPEIIAPILNITPDNLPEELVHYDVMEETIDGIRCITSVAPVSGIAHVEVLLDCSTIPVEQLQDVIAVMSLMGDLPAGDYSRDKLSSLISRYMGSFAANMTIKADVTGSENNYYLSRISWNALTEDIQASSELFSDILMNSDLSDTATIRQYFNRAIVGFTQGIDSAE